jgi:hypothetical protein
MRGSRCARLQPLGTTPLLAALTQTLRLLAKRWTALAQELRDLDASLADLTKGAGRRLLAQFGVGPQTAATLLVTAGDNPDRLRSEAAIMSCRLARTVRHCDQILLRPPDSCRSISRHQRRGRSCLVHNLPAASEKFHSLTRPLAISPAVKPPSMSAAACAFSVTWEFPSSARAAVRSMTALISMRECSRISAEGGPGRRLYGP